MQDDQPSREMNDELDIAIVGMAGRFPGARNLDEFWRNLVEGVESIAHFSDEELLRSGVPAAFLSNRNYVKAAPVLEEPGQFDADFFGFVPAEARTLDPQHRILLELAQEAIEDAGYDPNRYPGRIGVFTGTALNTYFMNCGLSSRFAEEYIPTLIGADKDFLSTRISYKLNLKGPSVTIQTACSTSMVAVHLARQSLLNGESDMALAGAISVRAPHRAGYFCDGGGVVSPDGHVRAFDAQANGTVFGSGGGVLVLKRLADALADGDNIHAVIKGSAVNNDGSEKAGYTTPSVNGQADVVIEALANAGVEAESIGYVEAHGSGTPVGDPVEIRALTKAFRTFTQRSGYCAIGSVKTNVGHLDAAAAVAGMIKTILALKHRTLPPSLHFTEANPEIDFKSTPFYVNTETRKWAGDGPRRAGVMSTGMGGTNAHVVFEEAPEVQRRPQVASSELLILSAKTSAALDRVTHRLREFLERNDAVNMKDVAHTLRVGRREFPHRRSLVCGSREDAIAALAGKNRVLTGVVAESAGRPVVFLFPGIGDHYVGMGHDLYESWDVFRQEVDRCAGILLPHLGADIRKLIYPDGQPWKSPGKSKGIDLKKMLGRGADAAEDRHATELNKTLFAQPALFTIEYAMARLWQSLGIKPAAMIGHSMGEYVAACLAGVLSLEDALRLIATRARLVNDLPQGAMLAVTLPEKELAPLLTGELSISLINGPALCVVAGPAAAVADFERLLNEKQIISRRVQNAHAFHSKMLSPIVGQYEEEVKKIRLNAPAIPYTSNVTGRWITQRDATSPSYWARHSDHTSRFSDALQELWKLENPIVLEIGPGRTLGVLAMQHPDRQKAADPVTVSSIRHHYENQPDSEFLLQNVGKLWISGVEIRWEGMHPDERRRRVSLPTYPFEKQTHWIENAAGTASTTQEKEISSTATNLDDWFYAPTWKRMPFPSDGAAGPQQAAFWLIFADQYGGGRGIQSILQARGAATSLVRFGKRFFRHDDGSFEINPAGIEDYRQLFRELELPSDSVLHIVHLGSVVRGQEAGSTDLCRANQNFGFYSLFHIAQAVGDLQLLIPIKIGLISNRLHSVTGEEAIAPAMATALGPGGVMAKEYPNIECFNIDLFDDQSIDNLPEEWLVRIVSEFTTEHEGHVIAYRGRYRWERQFQSIKLKQPVASSPPSEAPTIRRLRPGGVYLITGGTGGLGLALAEYLARTCRPHLVLMKRSPFPEKSRWKHQLTAANTPATVRKTLAVLLEIESAGAEVDVISADVSDRGQMQAAVADILTKHGTIHGVIHAAGIVRAEMMQPKTRESAEAVLAPKVYGAMILFELLKNVELDFMVLFSSISSVLAPYALSDYTAANSFLDGFAYFANAKGRCHTVSINWSGWKEVGMLAELETLQGVENWHHDAKANSISTKDGLEAFERILNSNLAQVIVSPEDLQQQIKVANAAKVVRHFGTQLTGSDPPTNTVEAALLEMWSSVFGSEQIGIHDNFADLGGHSLLAMQLVSRIRSLYQIAFNLRDFFESPTVAQQAALIQNRILEEIEGLTDEQARGRIAQDPL